MVVLGSGITGLLLGYLTRSPVVGPDVGGQLVGIHKGPRILELNADTEKLIEDLDIKAWPEVFTVGYLNDRPDTIESSANAAQRLSYYKKTRGAVSNRIPESVMSGGRDRISGWDIDKIDLVDRLAEKIEIVSGVVMKADFLSGVVEVETNSFKNLTFDIRDCVSTINLKRLVQGCAEPDMSELFYLYEGAKGIVYKSVDHLNHFDFSASDTMFIQVDVPEGQPLLFSDYSYIYCTDERNPINRITKVGPRTYVFETKAERYEEAVDYIECVLGYEIGLVETIRNCQLAHSRPILEIGLDRQGLQDSRLKLCGRFSQWDHSFRTISTWGRAREYKEIFCLEDTRI